MERCKSAADNGWTPLLLCSQNGNLSIVEYLINHEADANQADNDGVTSLAVAIANSHTEIAKFLLSKNANIETTKLFLKEKKEFGMIEILDKLCKEKNMG
jgi:ankyrin repeat protein